jgi:hypothetical protein
VFGQALSPALRRAARVLFWLTLAYVAFVTLSPIALRPETDFGPNRERFAAFAMASFLLMLGYPRHRFAWLIGLLAVAGLLEASQGLVPGRHGRWHDFEVKAGGAVAGALLALAAEWLAAAARRIRAR